MFCFMSADCDVLCESSLSMYLFAYIKAQRIIKWLFSCLYALT